MTILHNEIEKLCIRSGGKIWYGSFAEKRIYLKRLHLITLLDIDLTKLTIDLLKALATSETYYDCFKKVFFTSSAVIRDILKGKGFPTNVTLIERKQEQKNVSKEKTKSKSSPKVCINRLHYMELD